MNNETSNITKALRQMKDIFYNISLLLKTAVDILEIEGWKCRDSTAFGESSKSINNPKAWISDYYFRFLWNDKKPKKLLFVSVILDEDNNKAFNEPLFAIGCMDFNGGTDYHWHFAKNIPLQLNKANEMVEKIDYAGLESEKYHISNVVTAALPLAEITKTEDVKKFISSFINSDKLK